MPARIPDTTRQAIADAITAGGKRNQIARDFHVSPGTVSNIAAEQTLTSAFDRTATQNATRARETDMAELRSLTRQRLLRIANEQLDRVNEPCEVYAFGGSANEFNSRTLDRAPSAEVRNFMTSAAIAIDKHVLLDRHDADSDGVSEGRSLIREFMSAVAESVRDTQ